MSQSWELLDEGPLADAIERLNLAALDAAVEALILSRLARPRGPGRIPDEDDLKHLHRLATRLLLRHPGHYRETRMQLMLPDGTALPGFRPPLPRALPAKLRGFRRALALRWKTGDALDVAAFALWWIFFLHPFPNGNGRSAAAFAYACLCIKLGGVLPGKPTLLQRQTKNSQPVYRSLRIADAAFARTGTPDLGALTDYLDGLLLRQMKAARRRARRRARR